MLLTLGGTLTSCEDMFGDFLDKQPSQDLTEEDVFSSWTLFEESHIDTYNFLLHGANRINSSWLDAATDIAECSIGTSGTRTTFNIGNYYGSGGAAELTSIWESRYRAIRKCNQTLAHLDSVPQPASMSAESFAQNKTWIKSEARFLRAYFYWELFLRYGPVPIVTDVLDPNGDLLTGYTERPTVKEYVVDFILKELKECESGLQTYAETAGNGEVNQPTARALYARIMLYMASPHYASDSGITWQQAMDANKGFIDDYGANYKLMTEDKGGGVSAYNNAWALTAYTDGNTEVIFFRNDATIGWSGISTDTPVGEGGSGGNCPSQNLVDMYDMIDGSAPFTNYDATGAPVYDSNGNPTINTESGYSDAKMWENRDTRLASTVLYNGVKWNSRTINVVYGMSDNPIGNQNSTPTGYYMRKYIPETILSNEHAGTARRLWVISRYAEIMLNYAEAINEVEGPDGSHRADLISMLDQIRSRAGITGSVADRTDLNTQAAMRNFIHKERTIELAFEEHRPWDVRRWNVAMEALARPIYGINVASDGTITRKTAQKRVFYERMYLYPIPETEYWKTNIENNPGWE